MPLWTSSTPAQELLTEAALNPPPTRPKYNSDRDTHFDGYTGPIFRDLSGIRRRALDAIFFVEGASDNFFANADLTVDQAIDEAIAAGTALQLAA